MNKKNKKLAKKVKNKIIKSKTDDKIARLKSNLNIENVVSSKKLKVSMITAVVLLILLIIRLFYLQLIDGSHLSTLASKQQTTSETISSKRGNIYDSTGAYYTQLGGKYIFNTREFAHCYKTYKAKDING